MPAPDHSALHLLYSEHNGWLKSWLRARLGNASDAADLAQDTFVRLLASRDIEQIREPRTYLSAIARALMIDKFRRRALEQAYCEALALHPEPMDISPEKRLLILETLVAIDSMLDGLGERTRQIFLSVQLEGLSYVATGKRLGVSVTTVKKHVIRAMTHCLLLTED
ncbi:MULTISPECIES: sigma-70 family RNA polymerase sigma factor [Pseudomonas]|uniref:sigma-70 family RNA polymerase sigma factor n=1 Tax=Pseudomonas TaxID=286 RepID=UPI001294E865|nr:MULTISPECIES: sigma-70 family RNA polymerase sigma factor [Pseudomonas]MCU1757381.1 sigma-70 family RNA polymerase sigma factor [Pseudomonas helleri]MQT44823.1 sigma-70 family RNA polymerase sigma factor [Pseudomonas sp. FSL R10-0765]MQT54099.1 sigma-70 family RNA polymerase sigma factor [Pseudomonas sp. FSL R10-2398]MQT98799.1 sigma-70 family RNA polymerase sigma factor [Pseudomonas sp. FSL R10-2245]MQU09942.1 sigma-70 family RNA polymerase sigma factor [Pseudomonas sp. FSL R10-2189]